MMHLQARFPIDPTTGFVLIVPASQSVAPYTYVDGLKLDATGALVVAE